MSGRESNRTKVFDWSLQDLPMQVFFTRLSLKRAYCLTMKSGGLYNIGNSSSPRKDCKKGQVVDSLTHTRWSGGRGYLRRGKWIMRRWKVGGVSMCARSHRIALELKVDTVFIWRPRDSDRTQGVRKVPIVITRCAGLRERGHSGDCPL